MLVWNNTVSPTWFAVQGSNAAIDLGPATSEHYTWVQGVIYPSGATQQLFNGSSLTNTATPDANPTPAAVGNFNSSYPSPYIGNGTSDGTHNYFLEFGVPQSHIGSPSCTPSGCVMGVVESNLNGSNEHYLFDLPYYAFGGPDGYQGIAYDPLNDSLWISDDEYRGEILDYSLTGNLLSSFSTGITESGYPDGLALDPADGTLWLHIDYRSGTSSPAGWYQYTTSGTLLQQGSLAGIPNNYTYNAQFEEFGSGVPEPASVLLVCGGALILGLARRIVAKRG
jgi:hypothetical protein